MKKFAYEIGDSVGGRYDSIVRADVAKELKHFDKQEKENRDKVRNNVDEAMEEKLL